MAIVIDYFRHVFTIIAIDVIYPPRRVCTKVFTTATTTITAADAATIDTASAANSTTSSSSSSSWANMTLIHAKMNLSSNAAN